MSTDFIGAAAIALIAFVMALSGWIGLRAACRGEQSTPDWLETWETGDGA